MNTAQKLATLTAVAVAGLAVTVAPAHATDTGHCVTKTEFQNVVKYESTDRVAHIFDITGHAVARWDYEGHQHLIRQYRTCTQRNESLVQVQYTDGKVYSKHGYFYTPGDW